MSTWALSRQYDDETDQQSGGWHVRFMLSEQVLTRWQHLVAFGKGMNLFLRVVCTVLYHHTTMASTRPAKWVHFLSMFCLLLPWRPLGQYRVAAWWQLPGASGVALAMLPWAMSRALLQCIYLAIEMACNRGTIACCRRVYCLALRYGASLGRTLWNTSKT